MNSQNPKYPKNTSCVCRINGQNRQSERKNEGPQNRSHERFPSTIQFTHLFGFVNCEVLPREAAQPPPPAGRNLQPPAPPPAPEPQQESWDEEEEEEALAISYYTILTSLQI